MILLSKQSIDVVDNISSTGIAISENNIFRGIQVSDDSIEIVVYNKDGTCSNIIVNGISDVHDLLYYNDILYVVSTATNEVIALSNVGNVIKRWKFSDEIDSWHINCLGVFNNKVVLSCFGEFDESRGYKGGSLKRGFILELASNTKLINFLSQPHTLYFIDDEYFICDSETKRLLKFSDFENIKHEMHFNQYTRGLAFDDNYIYLGLSSSRNLENIDNEMAKIVMIDRKTYKEVFRVAVPFNEIYDIKIVESSFLKQFNLYGSNSFTVKYFQLKQELQGKDQELQIKEQELQSKYQELQSKYQELQSKYQELNDLLNSKSWKLTLPLRKFFSLIKNKC